VKALFPSKRENSLILRKKKKNGHHNTADGPEDEGKAVGRSHFTEKRGTDSREDQATQRNIEKEENSGEGGRFLQAYERTGYLRLDRGGKKETPECTRGGKKGEKVHPG